MSLKSFFKQRRLKLKHWYHQALLNHHDFSIISNNCWGTRTYQKYGLKYRSPFQSLFIFAPDYIQLITDFNINKLQISHFIQHKDSKYKDEILNTEEKYKNYPIGVLIGGEEIHFLHYKTEEDAKQKWDRRIKRINPNKLIFKFSDDYLATDALIQQFDNLPYKNKLCFTAKPYPNLQSVIFMEKFKDEEQVELEWKYDYKYINLHHFINTIQF